MRDFRALEMRITSVVAFLAAFSASNCGGEDEQQSWRGDEPHLVVEGTLAEQNLNINLTGASQVTAAEATCEREYDVPVIDGVADPSQAIFVGFEVNATVTIGGEEVFLEIDLEGPDFLNRIGEAITLVPDGEVVPGQAILEVKWTRISDMAELVDDAANAGTATIELMSGTPGEGGIIIPDNEGSVGLSADLQFTASESLSVSLTAACGANDVTELVDGMPVPTGDAGTPTGDAGTPTGDAGTPTGDAGTPTADAAMP